MELQTSYKKNQNFEVYLEGKLTATQNIFEVKPVPIYHTQERYSY